MSSPVFQVIISTSFQRDTQLMAHHHRHKFESGVTAKPRLLNSFLLLSTVSPLSPKPECAGGSHAAHR
jgi:hypothetical protein